MGRLVVRLEAVGELGREDASLQRLKTLLSGLLVRAINVQY